MCRIMKRFLAHQGSVQFSETVSTTYRSRRQFSCTTSPGLQLAYDLWPAPKEDAEVMPNQPIVFLHGLFGSKKNNRTMSKILARDLRRPVYALDLRNHGDSPQDPRHDYTALSDDVREFIVQHKLKRPTIIGHSMGAKTAMTLALSNPSMVGELISVDNAPVDAALKSDFGTYIRGMRKVEDTGIRKQSEADEILQEFEESLPIRQFLLTNLVRSSNDRNSSLKFRIPLKILGSALDNMADFPFKDPDSVQFKNPTLFVRGTKSQYVADEMLPTIGRFFPRFELQDIDSGHWVISENPHAFHAAVVDFLNDHS